MNEQLNKYLPNVMNLSAYAIHDTMLPYSKTTLKKDKNKMSKQTTGYVQVINGRLNNIEFILNKDGKYLMKCDIINKDKVKILNRK